MDTMTSADHSENCHINDWLLSILSCERYEYAEFALDNKKKTFCEVKFGNATDFRYTEKRSLRAASVNKHRSSDERKFNRSLSL